MPTRTKLHYLFSEYFSLSFVILIQNLIEFLGFSTFFLERERERVCVAFGLWSMWRDRRESPFYKWLRNSAFYLGGVYFRGCTAFERIWAVLMWVLNKSQIYKRCDLWHVCTAVWVCWDSRVRPFVVWFFFLVLFKRTVVLKCFRWCLSLWHTE